MKQFAVLLLMLIMGLNSSCEKTFSELCGGSDPDKTLPWLKNEIERLRASAFCSTISRSTYKNETVFILSNCDPNVSSIPFLYDCDGNTLNLTDDDYRNLKFTGPIELIWKNK